MKIYLFQLSKIICALHFIFFLNCSDKEFCNPLDPAPGDCRLRLIDNFDDGEDPNLPGYNPKFFFQLPDTPNIFTSYESRPENVHGGVGYSIKVDFDVSNENNSFGGWIQTVGQLPDGGFNAAKFHYLTFWIKTVSDSINFQIALKDTKEGPARGEYKHETDPKPLLWEIDNFMPTKEWKQARIPLSRILPTASEDPINLKTLYQLIFGFSQGAFKEKGGRLKGTFFIDEIAFEK
jgi:hypothetical protein